MPIPERLKRNINKSVSLFYTQFVLDLFFFSKQFRLTVLIKFFLKTKSKSSTNLNSKKERQEEMIIDQSTRFLIRWEKYTGKKSSER